MVPIFPPPCFAVRTLMSQRGGWLCDLTQEGIEPNPGPTSPRVLSNVSTHEDMLIVVVRPPTKHLSIFRMPHSNGHVIQATLSVRFCAPCLMDNGMNNFLWHPLKYFPSHTKNSSNPWTSSFRAMGCLTLGCPPIARCFIYSINTDSK